MFQALFTASNVGLFDVLRRRPELDAAEVAQELKASVRGTERLLEACVSLGLLKSKERRQFDVGRWVGWWLEVDVFTFAPPFLFQPARRPFIKTPACPSASCCRTLRSPCAATSSTATKPCGPSSPTWRRPCRREATSTRGLSARRARICSR